MTYFVLGRVLDANHRPWKALVETPDIARAMTLSQQVDAPRDVEAQVVAASALTAAELRKYREQIARREAALAA